jgi:hypothetical protein
MREQPREVKILTREQLLAGEKPEPPKKPRQTLQLNMVHRDEETDFYENDHR